MPPLVKRVLIPLLVVVIVAAIVAAVRISDRSGPSEVAGVVSLVPGSGDKVLVQSKVGIVVSPNYEASLVVNGAAIPPDQIDPPLNPGEVLFQPGPGKVIERLLPDRNCVTAKVWRRDLGPDTAASRDWCFRAS